MGWRMKISLRTITCYLFLFPICLYLIGLVKFWDEFEHAQYLIDDNRRIPLWFPHEISECYGTVKLSHSWFSIYGKGKCIGNEVASLSLSNITKFQIAGNIVCGIFGGENGGGDLKCHDRQSSGSCYFLLAKNALQCFENEGAYLAECSRHGIDGKDCASFEENFREFKKREKSPTPWNVLCNVLVHGLTPGELMACIICLIALWRLDKSEIGRY